MQTAVAFIATFLIVWGLGLTVLPAVGWDTAIVAGLAMAVITFWRSRRRAKNA